MMANYSNNKISQSKIKYTNKLPTSIITNGLDIFGYHLAKSLSSQGGYVIIIDDLDKELDFAGFEDLQNVAFLDYTALPDLVDQIRRLDYVFFLNHNVADEEAQISSQQFLTASSYLNTILNLSAEFEAKFLLTNSLKAHKALTAIKEYGIKLKEDTIETIDYYTEAELIRYSENLVTEAGKSQGINIKIIRLGQLLGEGVELTNRTDIGKIIWDLLDTKDIYIKGDGLNSSHYIHLLDGVYAVLKAQFSQETKTNIYTASYEQPISLLNIAYKLQEISIDEAEIRFIEEGERVVSFDFQYKPAPNLTEIGWSPKITFEEALSESYQYCQELKNLYSRQSDTQELEQTQNSALQNLIAERKQSESIKKQKYDLSMTRLQSKRRNKSIGYRIRKSILTTWDGLKSEINFLKDLTILDAFLYFSLIGIFVGIYFTILSPVIVIIRDFTRVNANYNEIILEIEAENWENIESRANNTQQQLDSIEKNLNRIDWLASILQREEFSAELKGSVQALSYLSQTIENSAISKSLDQQYYDLVNTELIFRPNNNSVLSIGSAESAVSDESRLKDIRLEFRQKAGLAERSLETYKRLNSQLSLQNVPPALATFLNSIEDKEIVFSEITNEIILLDSYLEDISDESYNVGFVIQDSSRMTHGGGQVTSIGTISYARGGIVGIRLSSIDNVQLSESTLTASQIAEVDNLAQIDNFSADELDTIDYFNYLASTDNYLDLVSEVVRETYNTRVDTSFILNTESLPVLLNKFGEVELNDNQINEQNYLSIINLLSGSSDSQRNSIYTNIYAVLFRDLLSNPEGDFSEQAMIYQDLSNTNLIRFNHDVFDSVSAEGEELFISFSQGPLTSSQPTTPQTGLNYQVDLSEITDDGDIEVENILNLTNIPNLEELLICSPGFSFRADINTAVSATDIYDFNVAGNNCNLIDLTSTDERIIEFSYLRPVRENSYEGNIIFISGIEYTIDVDITYSDGKVLQSSSPEANQNQNSAFYTRSVLGLFNFNLRFRDE